VNLVDQEDEVKKPNERKVDVQEIVPKSLTIEAELLAICNGEYSDKERWLAASNPCISGGTLLALLRSSSPVLRDGASANPSLTTEILKLAELSPNSDAWFYALDNPRIDVSKPEMGDETDPVLLEKWHST